MSRSNLDSPQLAAPEKSTTYETYEKGHFLLHDRYMYLGDIQKGSFGKVTLAIDIKTNTQVAMKAMHKSKDVQAMARHEIAVLRKLGKGNPHICQLLDSFDTEDFIVLVLEYCANGDLYDMIHSSKTAPRAVDVWNLAKEMYSGLTYSHSLGIYHRDLKPENILFTDKGRVKICDWGLATYTRHNNVFNVGTEKYMPPECFLRTPISSNPNISVETYDCRQADYWSFGTTLLTAVFGNCPFTPIRANCGENCGSADDFKLKKQEVKKSLESDTNFKNFVFYNRHEVLYDIYPDMNKNCFQIFMNLLKAGGAEDDLDSYNAKIQSRSLEKFIHDLENNWKYGLTIWEEDEIYANNPEWDGDFPVDETAHDQSVFDMDGFGDDATSLDFVGKVDEKPPSRTSTENDITPAFMHKAETRQGKKTTPSIPVPSLTESSYQPKSWCDLDMDDDEMDALIHSLSLHSVAPISVGAGKAERESQKNEVRIMEKEVNLEPEEVALTTFE